MRRLLKPLLVVLAIFGIAFAYRVLAVYRFRSPACVARAARPPVAAAKFPRRLVVMTYNIEGHAALLHSDHIAEIAEVINEIKPDIVGLNEAHRHTWQSRFDDHVAELQRLTQMNGAFGASYKLWGGEFGNAVLTRGEIVSTDVHELPGTGEPRSVLETRVRIGGDDIDFYVTHLTAWGKVNAVARKEQLQCVREYVTTSSRPFVLVGDMNAAPESSEVADFMSAGNVQLVGNSNDSTQKLMNERIDLIFVTPRWQVGSVRTLDVGPSDHRPVVAELIQP